MRTPVIVVGGGISGLCAAHWIRRGGLEVTVLEQGARPGGTMQTARLGGWMIENGPNSALETTPLLAEIFDDVGITGERVYADASGDNRYILRDGKLHALPMSAGAFLRTSLWSPGGKLRVFGEPFIGRADHEESVAEFVRRRLGREFLDYAINPFVAGVYAGNPEALSVRAAFPKLYALEEKYGGLVRGMIGGARERRARAEKAKDRAKMFSFVGGMQTFPRGVAASLGKRVHLGARVLAIRKEGRSRGYRVTWTQGGRRLTAKADAVILSVPAYACARLVQPLLPDLSPLLEGIPYPPVGEVFLGFREEQVGRPLDGFGFLVPAREQRTILGTIWSSTLFPRRAPNGHVALTTFVGGSRQPEVLNRTDRQLIDMVTAELRALMSVRGDPAFARVNRWDRAIPQYGLGYHRITDAITRAEEAMPGLYFCSNYRGGIAVGDCAMSARKTADAVLRAHA